MIESSLPRSNYYRAHSPQWASRPLSGAGAAKQGGRFNRPGVQALYLSDSPKTALAEYQQLGPLLPPCTLVSYHIAINKVVDFSGGFDASCWTPLWADWDCQWRQLATVDRIEPPSWLLGDDVRRLGFTALLFPSVVCSGTNLALFTESIEPNDVLEVYDPDGKLPRNRKSWT